MKRISSILFPLLVVVLAVASVDAQTKSSGPCSPGRQAAATGFWRWAANARVNVYIRATDFDPAQLSSVLTALNNWNSVSGQTESGVKFDYKGNTTLEENTCENCLTISRGRVFDRVKHHVTELRAYSAKSNQIITYASIVVDPVITNPKALLNAMLHELGHNLGLVDCYTCKRNSTVMNQFDRINEPVELDRPTGCDIAQVKESYKELKARVALAQKKRVVEDEGEEPEDDDTPIVVPPTWRPLLQL